MNHYLPDNEKIRVLGRTSRKVPMPLFWTGSGVEFCTDGSELTFVLVSDYSAFEQWIRVEVDGYSMIRTSLQKGENRITVYRGLNAEEKRRVQLFKEVQAMPNDPDAMLLLQEIETDGKLYDLPAADLKIEFIGDSLTSGEGLAGAVQLNDWQSCVFSTYLSYTQLIAKEMNAEIRVISQSGWGVYCSWDHLTDCALPLYYDQVCGVLKGRRNQELGAMDPQDFSSWLPDVVFVNLGSNDSSGLQDHPEEGPEAYAKAMNGFLKQLRKRNPGAFLIWSCGLGRISLTETAEKTMESYIRETGDERAALLPLPRVWDLEDPKPEGVMGSRNHPGPLANRWQADAIEKMIRDVLSK